MHVEKEEAASIAVQLANQRSIFTSHRSAKPFCDNLLNGKQIHVNPPYHNTPSLLNANLLYVAL